MPLCYGKCVDISILLFQFCVTQLTGETCDTGADAACSCDYKMKQIHFAVNYTLDSFYSRAIFIVIWSHDTDSDKIALSNKNYSLPEVCGKITYISSYFFKDYCYYLEYCKETWRPL